jgi:hypothetical protein
MKKQVKRIFTLSKYAGGMHTFNPRADGTPSFAESLSGLMFMLQELHVNGTPLGSKIEVTMTAKPKAKKKVA